MTQNLNANKGDVVLLIGTKKGAFILSGTPERKKWSVSGPHCKGGDVYHMTYDPRNGGSVLAAVNYMIWGQEIHMSNDFGQSWSRSEEPPKFANRDDMTIKNLWHIKPGRENEPGVLYAGVDPAALFKSEDSGITWQEITSLTDHPTRDQWQPGLGGLCTHSIVLDPHNKDRMWVGMSAIGVFGTSDGGQNWQPMNKGVRADFLPEKFPDFGQCPHKLLTHQAQPGLLYQQNHCGVYRSDNGGESWNDLTEGLPSRFGFVLGLHSQDPNTLYVIPEDDVLEEGEVGGGFRVMSGAKFRVFRSRNGGQDWEPMTKGLPQKNAYLHCMREGMATDSLDPCGIYVGTTNGQVFYSRDDGDSWELMVEYLPPINSVEVGMVQ